MPPNVTILDHRGNVVPDGQIQAARMSAYRRTAYEGAGVDHKDLATFRPRAHSGQSALDHDRKHLVDRIQDIERNDGWASAGMDRLVDNVIGASWNLQSQVVGRALGINDDEADELGEATEREWTLFARNPQKYADAARHNTVDANWALAFRTKCRDGEALAEVCYEERGGHYETFQKMIDPARLSNPYGRINDLHLRDGVELDDNGAAIGYHIRQVHPSDIGLRGVNVNDWERVERETEWGSARILHAFDTLRADQKRGIPLLAPIMRKFHQIIRSDDYEIQASMLNAVMAAYITSPFDHEALADSQGLSGIDDYNKARANFHAATGGLPEIQGAQVGMLYAGEQVQLTKPEHPNAVYESFVRIALRNIASCLGLTYEQFTMDWSNVNYSSARAALIEVFKTIRTYRARFEEQFVTPFYYCFLEEAYGTGRLVAPAGAPDFFDAPHLYAMARWIPQGKGWIDPLKEAQAANERYDGLLSNLADEHAEQGKDTREVIEQRARENRLLARNNVTRGEMRPIAPALEVAAP